MNDSQQQSVERLIAREFTELFPKETYDPARMDEMLEHILDERKRRHEAMFSMAWEMHTFWMASFTTRAVIEGLRADEDYTLMTDKDRAANRAFSDLMFEIINPHIPKRKPRGSM